jgi:hypothetical protein
MSVNRSVAHQRERSLGVGCGEQRGHRASLGDAEDDGAPRLDGVEHGADVVHPRLEIR